MKLPKKIVEDLNAEALKYARFSWYNGWEKSSGYISTTLSDDVRYGSCKIYIEWKKKKAPTDEQIKTEVEKSIQSFLNNEQHHSRQRDFSHFVQNKYYVDVRRLKHEAEISLVDSIHHVLAALTAYEHFDQVQELFNDLKNLECGLNDHWAIETFLCEGRKRIGES